MGKSIFELNFGDKLLQFLRFLSEFALRYHLINKYPNEQMEIFIINSKYKENEIKNILPYDINEIYEIMSNNENYIIESKILDENLNISKNSCLNHIKKQENRFLKNSKKFSENIDSYKNISKNFTEEIELLRKNFIQRKKIINEIKENIPINFLSEFRSLDRIPQIDISKELFKELSLINDKFIKEGINKKIESYIIDQQEDNKL